MRDIDGPEYDLHGEAGADGNGGVRIERSERSSGVEPRPVSNVRDVEVPVPLARGDVNDDVRIPRNGICRNERLERRNPDDDEDDRRDDGPNRLEATIPGRRVHGPFRVAFANAELEDRVKYEPDDQHADSDRGHKHEVEELLRRSLPRGERLRSGVASEKCDEDEGDPYQAHRPEGRH